MYNTLAPAGALLSVSRIVALNQPLREETLFFFYKQRGLLGFVCSCFEDIRNYKMGSCQFGKFLLFASSFNRPMQMSCGG